MERGAILFLFGERKMNMNLIKVRSLINREIYFTQKDFPTKEIDGKVYIRVLRNPHDKSLIFMKKENIEYIR